MPSVRMFPNNAVCKVFYINKVYENFFIIMQSVEMFHNNAI